MKARWSSPSHVTQVCAGGQRLRFPKAAIQLRGEYLKIRLHVREPWTLQAATEARGAGRVTRCLQLGQRMSGLGKRREKYQHIKRGQLV